jgi:CAP12/Pycsar effector protein, TIR domain
LAQRGFTVAESREFVVFYSWQNDSPKKTNRTAIADALECAGVALKSDLADRGFQLRIEEATRNEPGSPNIPQRILEKIDSCEIFVCDVTTINVGAENVERKTPNPNVLFELGYAVARLGWQRIVMLFNTAFGNMSDLPFDVDRQRASGYRLEEKNATGAAQKGLDNLLTVAIRTILQVNPPKRMDIASPEEERRRRDVANIQWLLEYVHWPTLEAHLEASPRFISFEVFHFWESFNAIIRSKSFYLYDAELLKKFESVRRHWARSLAFYQHYEGKPGIRGAIFTRNRRFGLTQEERRHWQEIEAANRELSLAIDDLLSDIRKRYLEVNIDQMNEAAWARYVAYENESSGLLKTLRQKSRATKSNRPKTPKK